MADIDNGPEGATDENQLVTEGFLVRSDPPKGKAKPEHEDEDEAPAQDDLEDQDDLDDVDAEAGAEDDPGDDAEDEDEAEAEAEEVWELSDEFDPLVKLKNGREVRLSELQNGNLRQQDYTRKTQEVAEQRKQLEAQRQELESALAQWAVNAPAEPDWVHLAQTLTPYEYQMAQAQHQQQKAIAQQAEQQYHALVEQHRQETLESEVGKLLDAVPEWQDEATRHADMQSIVSVARQYDFSDQELSSLTDSRMFRVLRDAAAYRKMQASNARTEKRVTKAAKTLQPGARKTKQERSREVASKALDRVRATKGDPAAFNKWLLGG